MCVCVCVFLYLGYRQALLCPADTSITMPYGVYGPLPDVLAWCGGKIAKSNPYGIQLTVWSEDLSRTLAGLQLCLAWRLLAAEAARGQPQRGR